MTDLNWIASSFCQADACVEVAHRKSSFCTGGNCVEVSYRAASGCASGTCVECGTDGERVYIRDSKDVTLAPIVVPKAAFNQFLTALTDGEIG